MRNFQFEVDNYYHVYNRGVDGRDIFIDNSDYLRFLRSMREFNNDSSDAQRDYERRQQGKKLSFGYPKLSFLEMPNLVEFVSYCLNSNHHHFLLKQLVNNGIGKFMHKLNLGYTKYFNERYSRSGSLFQGTYKAVKVEDYGHLLKLLVYVNCNHEIHNLGQSENWPWSSYLDSMGLRSGTLCNNAIIKEEFGQSENFKSFCKEIIPEIKESKVLRKYLLE